MEWRHIVTTRRSCVLAIRLQLPSWQQDPDGEAESDLMSGEAFSLLRKTRHALTTRQKPELSMLESSSKEQFEKILEEVQSKDALTRLHALAKISVLEPGESADVLRRIIRSNEPEVQLRALAVLAVGYLRCDGALELLEGVLSVDPSEEVRADALAALGELGDARAVPVLVRALYEEPHWMCQLQAATSLGLVGRGDDRAYEALVKGLDMDPRPLLRNMHRACMLALSLLGDVRCVPRLLESASSPNWITRQMLAEALGNLDCEQSVSALRYLQRDAHPNVREWAALSLRKLRPPEPAEPGPAQV